MSIFCFALTQTVWCQSEKLGIVNFTAPRGWAKTTRENVIAFSELNESTGRFCIITLYGATPGTGTPQGDFNREWNNLVKPLGAKTVPKTVTEIADGWTATAGGGEVDFQGMRSVAFLTVFSNAGRTVSILGVLNDESYLSNLTAFVTAVEMDKTVAPPTQAADGKFVIPMPTRQLTVADIAGEWGETAGFSTTYVDRYTGTYAGTDSLHYRSKMTITLSGGYLNDFFAIQNGKKIVDKTSGTVTIVGRVLSIKQKNTAKYVIRGWLELPEMTVLEVCGPWYDDDVIPETIFSNPEQGSNLNKKWIRKK